LIDGGFALGKVVSIVEPSTGRAFSLTTVGILAKLLGTFIAFWKGVIQK
jgi:hypothetical protein